MFNVALQVKSINADFQSAILEIVLIAYIFHVQRL